MHNRGIGGFLRYQRNSPRPSPPPTSTLKCLAVPAVSAHRGRTHPSIGAFGFTSVEQTPNRRGEAMPERLSGAVSRETRAAAGQGRLPQGRGAYRHVAPSMIAGVSARPDNPRKAPFQITLGPR